MKIRFLSPATKELNEAIRYYNEKRPDLGLRFADEIRKTAQRVVQYPEDLAVNL